MLTYIIILVLISLSIKQIILLKKIHFKIIIHERIVFEGDVDAVYAPGESGRFGILPDHIPFMSALNVGVVKIENDKKARVVDALRNEYELNELLEQLKLPRSSYYYAKKREGSSGKAHGTSQADKRIVLFSRIQHMATEGFTLIYVILSERYPRK